MKSLLTVDEAKEVLNIGRTLLYSLLLSGQLESVKIGSRRLIPNSAIESFIERLQEAGVS